MIILFPKENGLKRLCNSIFRGSSLCPEHICGGITPKGKLDDTEHEVLSEIQKTVLLVNKRVEDLIREIPFHEISTAYEYENSFTNWRDRSHFVRLCLEMLDKEIDDNVISIMGSMEVFYLSWLIADEAIDETERCEGKNTYYGIHGKIPAISASNVVQIVISGVIKRVSKNKKLEVDVLQKMLETFSRMLSETWYGFYKDIKITEKLEEIIKCIKENKNWCAIEERQYFDRIELVWGSHFEGAIRLALALFPEIDEGKVQLLGRIGGLWGKMLKLRDDIMDIVGDKHGLGREPLEDIIITPNTSIVVKKTLPIIRWLCHYKKKGDKLSQITNCGKVKIIADIKNKAINGCIRELELIASEIINLFSRLPDNSAKTSLLKLIELAAAVRC